MADQTGAVLMFTDHDRSQGRVPHDVTGLGRDRILPDLDLLEDGEEDAIAQNAIAQGGGEAQVLVAIAATMTEAEVGVANEVVEADVDDINRVIVNSGQRWSWGLYESSCAPMRQISISSQQVRSLIY